MSDEEFIFKEDVKEKKNIAKGAFNKKRTGGKHVKTPSDYLSKKELCKMNSEVVSYNLKSPMDYESFKRLPLDLQKEYITNIIDRFGVYAETISSKMFRLHPKTLNNYLRTNGIPVGHHENKRIEKLEDFYKWLGTEDLKNDIPEEDDSCNTNTPELVDKPPLGLFTTPKFGILEFENEYIDSVYYALKNLLIGHCHYDITVTFIESERRKNKNEL